MTDKSLLIAALGAPRTIEELAELFGCSVRTMYRRLDALGGAVMRYGIGRPARYVVTDTAPLAALEGDLMKGGGNGD